MKIRKRLKEMRQTKLLGARLSLAKDEWPGTQCDRFIFELICLADYFDQSAETRLKSDMDKEQQASLLDAGFVFAKIIKHGKSDALRKIANAVDQWHAHKPCPDKIRAELLKYQMRNCNNASTVHEIEAYLKKRGIDTDANKRTLYRAYRDLEIKINYKAGRPRPLTRKQ